MSLTPAQRAKVEQYITLFNEDSLNNDNLDFVIEDSVETLSEDVLGKFYEKAIALLTLHTLTIAQQTTDGTAGEGYVIQRTIGPITIKWANPTSSKDKWYSYYRSTKYGQMLVDILKQCSIGAGINVNHMWRLI